MYLYIYINIYIYKMPSCVKVLYLFAAELLWPPPGKKNVAKVQVDVSNSILCSDWHILSIGQQGYVLPLAGHHER